MSWTVPPYLTSPFNSAQGSRVLKVQLFHIFFDPLYPSLLTRASSPNTYNLNISTLRRSITVLLSLHVSKPSEPTSPHHSSDTFDSQSLTQLCACHSVPLFYSTHLLHHTSFHLFQPPHVFYLCCPHLTTIN